MSVQSVVSGDVIDTAVQDNDVDSVKIAIKRDRESALEDDDDKGRNRGNYRCSKLISYPSILN
jgi:hypothetical protein